MNRTPLLSLASALGLTLNKSPSSSTGSPSASTPAINIEAGAGGNKHRTHKEIALDDEIGPLTASPPASPATRISRSSASFFPTAAAHTGPHRTHSQHHNHQKSAPKQLNEINRIGSFGTHNLPKLRESKWFTEAEARIFCVVAEVGFIVEIRKAVTVPEAECNNNNHSAKEYKSLFGVVTKKECNNQSAEDKKQHTYKIEITTIDERKKLDKLKLTDVWATNNEIRINNFNDKNKVPHEPSDILDKILFARRSKNLSWHNTEHFSYWCRYGEKPVESLQRRRQVSECIRWGSHAGVGTGMLMLFNRRKTTSK